MMLKKLRVRFIALAMASLCLVLGMIIGTINALNYHNILEDANSVLTVLAENDGHFPQLSAPDLRTGAPGRGFSPEMPYESRYFSALLTDSGEILAADVGKIAAVDVEDAGTYARQVWRSGRQEGFFQNYRYIVQAAQAGQTRIIFLDCGRSLATFRTFLLTSCAISLIGLLAVWMLLAVCSGRVIRPIAESYEKQRRFITDAGHELKTPLTVIDADAEILTMEYGENQWVRDIQGQTKRLAALTNDLISLSRMEEDGTGMRMIEFPFSDLIEELALSFQSLARVQGKNFLSDIVPMLSLWGDEAALGKMVSILLDNALKYSDEGGSIFLKLERQGKTIRLSISNTTPAPVTQEQLNHMFDRFYRADRSRSSATGGYGIGLSIAQAVAARPQGKDLGHCQGWPETCDDGDAAGMNAAPRRGWTVRGGA